MKNKQIVHIPVKVEDELPKENCKVGIIINGEFDFAYFIRYNDQKNFIFDHHKSGLHHKQKDITHWLKPTDVFVFSPEELKQLLEDYTDKIIENVAVTSTYIDEVYDSNFEDTALSNEMIFLRTDNDGMPYAANKVTTDKNSITNQLTEFLKQL